MADLTIEYFKYCLSAESFKLNVENYTVSYGHYQYDWFCPCKGFKFRRKCKHIEEAKKSFCGWDEFVDGYSECSKCPKCGGETSSRGVGV